MFDLPMYESDSQSFASKNNKGSLKGRLLALDIGDKRIGMAVSDPLMVTAQGLPTLLRQGKKYDIHFIVDIISQYDVTKVIYGLPKNMNGSLGSQAKKIEDFITHLKLKTNCLFFPSDERLTTQYADQTLKQSGMSRKKRAGKVDMVSAVLILQNFLDQSGHSER
jgi:putative Holliday junction resolvase